MDGRAPNIKIKFPDIPNIGPGSAIPDLKGSSLFPTTEKNRQNSFGQRQIGVLQLLWQALQKPLSKIGLIILFLAFVMILTPNAPVLLWIGMAGVVTSATMIGFSLFNTKKEYTQAMQNNSDNTRGEFVP